MSGISHHIKFVIEPYLFNKCKPLKRVPLRAQFQISIYTPANFSVTTVLYSLRKSIAGKKS